MVSGRLVRHREDTGVTDRVELHCGDALETLRGLPAGSVQTCVTSPPFYGLRDYAHCDCDRHRIPKTPDPDLSLIHI